MELKRKPVKMIKVGKVQFLDYTFSQEECQTNKKQSNRQANKQKIEKCQCQCQQQVQHNCAIDIALLECCKWLIVATGLCAAIHGCKLNCASAIICIEQRHKTDNQQQIFSSQFTRMF